MSSCQLWTWAFFSSQEEQNNDSQLSLHGHAAHALSVRTFVHNNEDSLERLALPNCSSTLVWACRRGRFWMWACCSVQEEWPSDSLISRRNHNFLGCWFVRPNSSGALERLQGQVILSSASLTSKCEHPAWYSRIDPLISCPTLIYYC